MKPIENKETGANKIRAWDTEDSGVMIAWDTEEGETQLWLSEETASQIWKVLENYFGGKAE